MTKQTVAKVIFDGAASLGAVLGAQPYPPTDPVLVARGEVEQIMGFAAHWSRTRLLTELSTFVDASVFARYRALLDRRLQGEPLQYILGGAEFFGHRFHVRPGCLIPRPETEILVEKAVDWILRECPDARVVDLGTGSGCIATSIALACSGVEVSGIDLSDAALAIARENAASLGARVTFHACDGLDYLRALRESPVDADTVSGSAAATTGSVPSPVRSKPNVLVSNPPYIPTLEVTRLNSEVQHFEPRLALDGGDDGLDVYRAICDLGPDWFSAGPAALFYEVGDGQAPQVIEMYASNSAWDAFRFRAVRDLRQVERVVVGERLG